MDLIKNNEYLLVKETEKVKERIFKIKMEGCHGSGEFDGEFYSELTEEEFLRNLPFLSALNYLTTGWHGMLDRDKIWSRIGYTEDEIKYFNGIIELNTGYVDIDDYEEFSEIIDIEIFSFPCDDDVDIPITLHEIEIKMYDVDGKIYDIFLNGNVPTNKDSVKRFIELNDEYDLI